ncbi:hypothetical protein PENTCL1PPCAC_7823, partial [Pristionchus entomophagus]
SSLLDAAKCGKCKISQFRWIVEAVEEKKKKKMLASEVVRARVHSLNSSSDGIVLPRNKEIDDIPPLDPIHSTTMEPNWRSSEALVSPPYTLTPSLSPPIPSLLSLSIDEPIQLEGRRKEIKLPESTDEGPKMELSYAYLSEENGQEADESREVQEMSLGSEDEERRDKRGPVACEKTEDVIAEESVNSMLYEDDEMHVNPSGEIEQDPPSDLVSTHVMAVDASDVIIEESENPVDGKEDVVVEEAVEEEEKLDISVPKIDPVANSDSDNMEIEKSESMIEPVFNEDATRTAIVTIETQSSIDYESDIECPVFSEDKEETADDLDSDDLLSGEEDQWISVGPRPLSRLSIVSDAESAEEEEDDVVRDIIDRMVEACSTPSPTISLENEDTVSSRGITSDEETINYDYASDSSSVSCESSDTVVGEGRGYGR